MANATGSTLKIRHAARTAAIAAAAFVALASQAGAQAPSRSIPVPPVFVRPGPPLATGQLFKRDYSDPVAIIRTSLGVIKCELFARKAPLAVKNFIGLAEGTKDWTDPVTHKLMHDTPLYNGLTFHRVIPEFMIQGGDPEGNGLGSPVPTFADEISPDLTFSIAGRLAMANSGPNSNSSQFFITTQPAPHLNGHYSLFGQVIAGQGVVTEISWVARSPSDQPLRPVKIISITIQQPKK